MRVLKVQPMYDAHKQDSITGSELRLRGKWLKDIFDPNSRVTVEVQDGQILIRKENVTCPTPSTAHG